MNRFVQFSLIALALNWPAWGQIQQSRTAQGARLITAAAPQDRDDQAKRDQDDDDRRRDRNHRRHDRRSEEHTSELQSRLHLVCRLLLEKKKKKNTHNKRNATSVAEL